MTITPIELLFYAGGLFILFLTPGPVWVALLARAMSGGFRSAWPLAFGVVVGDVIWPLIAVLGVTWIVDQASWFMDVLKWVAVAMFITMGILLIRHADKELSENSSLTRPGMWAGFIAGVVVIMSNPKAVLFYMGVLPGFFDLTRVTGWDIAAICFLSFLVPLLGNLVLAASVDRVRGLLKAPGAVRKMNVVAGWLLIGVGVVIGLS
ncbi:threonine/homoserine/homoserine lactone efflux protein [Litoreibacter meonggei]|uniref:Threonine/homoserine/homoserine lactone efflux protein n=1 Tax=Litoreibacter meonggei TaxID=1049199 RepID=A0A497VWI7_9RHOB|nr:LysE family translocator [Litoreibacter meonggei]RLJ41213.1 threonine/homoserine/homoserine lactone efflux protein [Litoreibacter meonggei]